MSSPVSAHTPNSQVAAFPPNLFQSPTISTSATHHDGPPASSQQRASSEVSISNGRPLSSSSNPPKDILGDAIQQTRHNGLTSGPSPYPHEERASQSPGFIQQQPRLEKSAVSIKPTHSRASSSSSQTPPRKSTTAPRSEVIDVDAISAILDNDVEMGKVPHTESPAAPVVDRAKAMPATFATAVDTRIEPINTSSTPAMSAPAASPLDFPIASTSTPSAKLPTVKTGSPAHQPFKNPALARLVKGRPELSSKEIQMLENGFELDASGIGAPQHFCAFCYM